jgi:hypothetical protein
VSRINDQYFISPEVEAATVARGIWREEVKEAVEAPSYNRTEVWWENEIVHVFAAISGGRRLVVSCNQDRLSSRRDVYQVRDMFEDEYEDFMRRSR